MRLLFFTTVYPSCRAPLRGIYNESLVAALAGDHEVRVVAPVPWTFAFRAVDGERARAEGPPVQVSRPAFLYPPGVLHGSHGWLLWQSARPATRRLLRTFRPDAVVSYWAHPDGEAARLAAVRAGAPFVLIVGGSDVLVLPRRRDRREAITRVLRSADAILAVGSDLRRRVIELGIPERGVHLFRRGVSERFQPGDRLEARRRLALPSRRKILLWVGNMVPVKAVGLLLGATASLVEEGRDLHLCLVGDGPLRGQLEESVSGTPLDGRVHFAGPVGHDRLPDWYRAADLTVLPSESEGTPNVLLESMACGTPFVASAVGGVPSLSSRPEEELVPAGDAAALAHQIGRQLDRPPARADPPPPFRWRDSADQLISVVRSVL